jgi:hypothetical protein
MGRARKEWELNYLLKQAGIMWKQSLTASSNPVFVMQLMGSMNAVFFFTKHLAPVFCLNCNRHLVNKRALYSVRNLSMMIENISIIMLHNNINYIFEISLKDWDDSLTWYHSFDNQVITSSNLTIFIYLIKKVIHTSNLKP